MIRIKTNEEVELIRESALLVSSTLAELASILKPGITTAQLDKRAEEFILSHQAIPSFKNYRGYPFATCISVNDAVVHGFPTDKVLKEGDLVSIDVGVYKNGFHGDSAYTFGLSPVLEEHQLLMRVTRESLMIGIEKAISGNRVGDVSNAIQEHAERKHHFGVVRELVGHGVGKQLHEDPQVPNYGKKGAGPKLKDNMVIAIEPMINLGTRDVVYDSDGWTVRTRDGKYSAHYEHTVCIKKNKADILSSFSDITTQEKNNAALFSDY
ncbi:MAG: type methionyl aminopeptidase [Bacteroidota bacterium]|jgi:methionyl aminopeptidase|nr:type I methionyl aminopeptidase [Chitinophagia bacterium]